MADPVNHYETLQVARNAGDEVVRGAYRYLVQKWHPDRNPHRLEEAERQIRVINEAYRVLSDLPLRREHDRWLDRRKAERRAAEAQAAATAPPAWSRPPEPALPEPARRVLVDSLSARHTWWILPVAGVAILWLAARLSGPSLWNLVWALLGGIAVSHLCSRLLAIAVRRQDDAGLQRSYARQRSRSQVILAVSLLAIGMAYLGERGHLGFDGLAAPLAPWVRTGSTEVSRDIDHRRLRPPCATDDGRAAGFLPGTAASLRKADALLSSACSP